MTVTTIPRFSIGDYQDMFSIQSTSKPFTYALALDHIGAEVGWDHIGAEVGWDHIGAEVGWDHIGAEVGWDHIGSELVWDHNGADVGYDHIGAEAGYDHIGAEAGYYHIALVQREVFYDHIFVKERNKHHNSFSQSGKLFLMKSYLNWSLQERQLWAISHYQSLNA